MNQKHPQPKIRQFIKAFVESRKGQLTEQSDGTLTIKLPDKTYPNQCTYDPAVAREKKALLLTPGSPAFQQILDECLQNGALCQISLSPRENFDALLRLHFKDTAFTCEDCEQVIVDKDAVRLCREPQLCFHQIRNGKIAAINILKKEPLRYFLFCYSATFQNKLRPKNEETIAILMDEKGASASVLELGEDNFLMDEALEIHDLSTKLKTGVFEELKKVADETLEAVLAQKLVFFDLPLDKEKASRLSSFSKRLRRERREQVISKRRDFDYVAWQTSYDTLLKREEESFLTSIVVKFTNLVVINTSKVAFQVNLDNHATMHSSFILGITQPEVTCPICKKTFSEGFATQDALYVCGNCIRRSIDTGKIYSKKAPLKLDETLQEFIEADGGFVCAVCGKRHSRLLEFKCSHDNTSVCIYHYDRCDVCGKVFSKLNLCYTDEFKRRLCPKHADIEKTKEP